VAGDVDPTEREFLLQRLKDKGIEIQLSKKVEEVRADGLIAIDKEWRRHHLKGDFIILAMGMKPDKDLARSLEEKGIGFYAIGDCSSPRKIFDAIQEGAHVGRQV
jgi:NAD(P)H-nitrite reductase large subunit